MSSPSRSTSSSSTPAGTARGGTAPGGAATSTPAALLGVAWTLVVLPLLYGLVQTIRTASALFTG